VQELKANPDAHASGVVIESKLDPGRGVVATILVNRGTMHVGDALVGGSSSGKVKAMSDFRGKPLKAATPSVPVEVLGFDVVPQAGEYCQVVDDERRARTLATGRTDRIKAEALARRRSFTLDDVFDRIKEGEVKDLNLIIKADVAGSVEALEEALKQIQHEEVKINVIHTGVGAINESDVMLAAASRAIALGFNVRPSSAAKTVADLEGVDIRTYSVIYKVTEDVKAALIGMLEPTIVEEEMGEAEIREVFKASKIGNIAGCYVTRGKVSRNAQVRLVREGTIVHEGKLASLKRFKEDTREVEEGYECGILLEDYNDIKEGDVLEFFETKEVKRT
jgi:translation initiation factor IF-2